MLKLRTQTYPFMSHLKYKYPSLNLTSDCVFCLGKKEDLAHIVLDCPKYEHLRELLDIDIQPDQDRNIQILLDKSLTNFKDNKLNMFKIEEFLRYRWKILNPYINELLGKINTHNNPFSQSTIQEYLTLV